MPSGNSKNFGVEYHLKVMVMFKAALVKTVFKFPLANISYWVLSHLASNYFFNHLLTFPVIYLCGFQSSWLQNFFTPV